MTLAARDDRPRESGLEALEAREERSSSLRRYVFAGACGLLLLCLIGGAIALFLRDKTPPPRPAQELRIVKITPPPPPPPPPPQETPPPPPEQKMIEQPKMAEPEVKEEKPAEEPKEAPPDDAPPPMGPLGLDEAPEGPGDQFNLAGNPGGRGFTGGGGGGGSRWGWYCTIVQEQIETALRANPKTRNFVAQIEVRLWADGSGRISRVLINPSTGDPAVDAAIQGEGLSGLVLRQPPPQDMPMPIVARITGRRSA